MDEKKRLQNIIDCSPNPIAVIGGVGFNVNSWGSCQYSGALDIFISLNTLSGVFGPDNALKKLKLKVSFTRIRDDSEILGLFIDEMKDRYEQLTEDEIKENGFLEYCQKAMKDLPKVKTIDDMFRYCNDITWDLWETADVIVDLVFENLKIKFRNSVLKSTDKDKEHIRENEYNYSTGIYCWLLYHHCGVSEEVFKNFCT